MLPIKSLLHGVNDVCSCIIYPAVGLALVCTVKDAVSIIFVDTRFFIFDLFKGFAFNCYCQSMLSADLVAERPQLCEFLLGHLPFFPCLHIDTITCNMIVEISVLLVKVCCHKNLIFIIFVPAIDCFHSYLVRQLGGYLFRRCPRLYHDYTATACSLTIYFFGYLPLNECLFRITTAPNTCH